MTSIEYRAFPGLTWGSGAPALGNPDGGFNYTQWYQHQHNAGLPVNAIGINNAGPLMEVQNSSGAHPDDVLIWRDSLWSNGFDPNNPDFLKNPEEQADIRFNYKYDVRWPPELDKERIWLKDENETRTKLAIDGSERMWEGLSVGEWQGRYNLRFAQLAVEHNRRVVLLSVSSGDHDLIFWNNPSMIELFKFAAANKHNVMIGLHEYSYVKYNLFATMNNDNATWQELLATPFVGRKVGRFYMLMKFLEDNGLAYFNMYFPEWGWAQGQIPEFNRDAMEQIDLFWEHIIGKYAPYVKGLGTWYSDDWYDHQSGEPIKYQVQRLFEPMARLSTDKVYTAEDITDPPPIIDPPPIDPPEPSECLGTARQQYKRTMNVAMHSHTTAVQREMIYNKAAAAGESVGPSADDGGIGDLNDKTAILWEIPGDEREIFTNWFEEHYLGTQVEFKYLDIIDPPPINPSAFAFTHWPTEFLDVTQEFGANPQNYAQFGLPGHEGDDVRAPHGSKIFAVADGIISNIIPLSQGSAYGLGVRVNHGSFDEEDGTFEYETTYAHNLEILVRVGDRVVGGQLIAKANNTGNSFGDHCHLTLKKKFATLEDQFGVWPHNIHDPTWYLDAVGGDEVSWPGGSPGIPPTIPPPVASSTYSGLHASADSGDGVFLEQVLGEYRTLKPGVVKFLSSHSPAMIASVAADNKTHIKHYIIRAFLSWGGRDITSQQFFNDTISDVQRSVNALIGQGIMPSDIGVELHNEMNLALEGSWTSWQNGYECGSFFNDVVERYKNTLPPSINYGLGGLSPGGFMNGIRLESTQFVNEMITTGVFDKMDYNYVHVYTVDDWEGSYEMSWVNFNLSILPELPIYITESSYHTPVGEDGHRTIIHGTDYAARLNRLMTKLDSTPVKGVTFYCASASNRSFRHESWVISKDAETPYADPVIRGIAAALRHQRPL